VAAARLGVAAEQHVLVGGDEDDLGRGAAGALEGDAGGECLRVKAAGARIHPEGERDGAGFGEEVVEDLERRLSTVS
jgi:hypothetical protein